MDIRGIVFTSVIEWPGKISAVVFVVGCNFRCPFCHNKDLVLSSESLPRFSEEKILKELEKRKKWLDAIVVTGGEPTLQPDLDQFLKKLKNLGFLTMVETNGYRPKILRTLLKKKLLSRIAMDIKGPLSECYWKIANPPDKIDGKLKIADIEESISLIIDSGIEYEFRTTVVPRIHDKKVLMEMAGQLKQQVKHWYWQQFQAKNCLDPKFNKIKPYTGEELTSFLVEVRKTIPDVSLR